MTLQQGALQLAGTVLKVAPMRTFLRDADGVVVSLPNKVRCACAVRHCRTLCRSAILSACARRLPLEILPPELDKPNQKLAQTHDDNETTTTPHNNNNNTTPHALKSITEMIIFNRSRHAGRVPAALGGVMRQPLRAKLKLPGGGRPVSELSALRDAVAARLDAAEREGVLAPGSGAVKLARVTEAGVELMVTVRLRLD